MFKDIKHFASNMSFDDAVSALVEGFNVKRNAWGDGRYLSPNPTAPELVDLMRRRSDGTFSSRDRILFDDLSIIVEMKGSIIPVPSSMLTKEDVKACDWHVVEELSDGSDT